MFNFRLHWLVIVWFVVLVGCRQSESNTLVLATTTSTYDSGLLDAILPDFEEQFDATVKVIAVGTGQAIALGEAGDADVILVHARAREEAFVAEGYGVERFDVMMNDFVILGPPDDPANIANAPDIGTALQRIMEQEALFVSRGDDSGTHIREQALWANAGIEPNGDWYRSIGQGMGATLTVANESQAYTLSDRGTYIARLVNGLNLVVLVEGDTQLMNPYSVIAVNPERHPTINNNLANDFIKWLLSSKTQEAIGHYQVHGEQLFFPNATLEGSSQLPPPNQYVQSFFLMPSSNH